MNGVVAVLLVFAALGLLDCALGARLGLQPYFQQGLSAMGGLCMSMVGIYCAVSAIAQQPLTVLSKPSMLFDASVLPSMLLAVDMGGWAAARALAQTPQLAAYSGLLVASTIGCLVSFTLPVSVGSLPSCQVMGFMQGVVWGMAALPVGLVMGGLLLGLSPVQLVCNTWPVALLCGLLTMALRTVPRPCLRVLSILGHTVRIAGMALFGVVVLGIFVPRAAVISQDLLHEALIVVLKITIVVCGAMGACGLVMTRCTDQLSRIAHRLGVNDYAVLGLAACMVSHLSMLPLYEKMDTRGKVMNAAMAASGAFVAGGQLAFVSAQESVPKAVVAFLVCKLTAGALAVWLAGRFTGAEGFQRS